MDGFARSRPAYPHPLNIFVTAFPCNYFGAAVLLLRALWSVVSPVHRCGKKISYGAVCSTILAAAVLSRAPVPRCGKKISYRAVCSTVLATALMLRALWSVVSPMHRCGKKVSYRAACSTIFASALLLRALRV